jgi:hypothetical protein
MVMIYPQKLIEIFLGRAEVEGYSCPKQCIQLNGYVNQAVTRILYFDCVFGSKGDNCVFLKGFLSSDDELGIRKKRGNIDEIINDLVDAIELSEQPNVQVPFTLGAVGQDFSPDKLESFFRAFLDYDSNILDTTDNAFTIEIVKKIKKPRSRENIRKIFKDNFFKIFKRSSD